MLFNIERQLKIVSYYFMLLLQFFFKDFIFILIIIVIYMYKINTKTVAMPFLTHLIVLFFSS